MSFTSGAAGRSGVDTTRPVRGSASLVRNGQNLSEDLEVRRVPVARFPYHLAYLVTDDNIDASHRRCTANCIRSDAPNVDRTPVKVAPIKAHRDSSTLAIGEAQAAD